MKSYSDEEFLRKILSVHPANGEIKPDSAVYHLLRSISYAVIDELTSRESETMRRWDIDTLIKDRLNTHFADREPAPSAKEVADILWQKLEQKTTESASVFINDLRNI